MGYLFSLRRFSSQPQPNIHSPLGVSLAFSATASMMSRMDLTLGYQRSMPKRAFKPYRRKCSWLVIRPGVTHAPSRLMSLVSSPM